MSESDREKEILTHSVDIIICSLAVRGGRRDQYNEYHYNNSIHELLNTRYTQTTQILPGNVIQLIPGNVIQWLPGNVIQLVTR